MVALGFYIKEEVEMRLNKVTLATVALSVTCVITAFAGQWLSDSNGWWYRNDDGSYPTNGWQWIDGNNDGIAESYYFNEFGYCLMNTTTPDGYQVNENGAWTENGVVQTRQMAVAANSASNSSVQNSSNKNGTRLDSTVTTDCITYTTVNGKKYTTLQNKTYEDGILLANGDPLTFYLEGKYNTLEFEFSAEDTVGLGKDSTYRVTVYGDDDQILEQFTGLKKTAIKKVKVDVTGQQYLCIETYDEGYDNNPNYNSTIFDNWVIYNGVLY